jgi:hypothetical protein
VFDKMKQADALSAPQAGDARAPRAVHRGERIIARN